MASESPGGLGCLRRPGSPLPEFAASPAEGAAWASVALQAPQVIPARCQGGKPLLELLTRGEQSQRTANRHLRMSALHLSPAGPLPPSPQVSLVHTLPPPETKGQRDAGGGMALCPVARASTGKTGPDVLTLSEKEIHFLIAKEHSPLFFHR